LNIIINLEGQTIEEIPSKIRSQNLKQSKYFIMMKQLKKIVFLLSVFAAFTSCSTQNKANVKNEELVKKYVQAVEMNDAATMESLLADEYLGVGPSINDSINKPDAIANWKYSMANLYESIHYEKSRILSVNVPDGENKGEWVSNWAELTIVYKTGEEIAMMANTVYKIENDKIVKTFTFYNEADVYEQLGVVYEF